MGRGIRELKQVIMYEFSIRQKAESKRNIKVR